MTQSHVIAVGLQSYLNAGIRAWFAQFNIMPPLPLAAAKVETDAGPATFEHMLTLVAASHFKALILIAHGLRDGFGLTMPLVHGAGQPHTEHTFLQRLMDLDQTGAAFTADDRRRLGIDQKAAHRLIALMRKVRDKKFDCIEWRSCNLGRNALSLDRFRKFFGARLMGAPDIHNFFGSGPAGASRAELDHHAKLHGGGNWETYKFPSAYKSPELVCCFRLNGEDKPEKGHVVADSPATLDAWIKTYLMPTGSRPKGEMAIHGMWNIRGAIHLDPEEVNNPLSPSWGGPDVPKLILPLTEKYRKHVIYSR